MKKVAIIQSNYIPWKGYFDMIHKVDEFILYDDVQYTRRDWRNRNKIMTPNGPIWLSIPMDTKGKYYQKINEAKVIDNSWVEKHKKSIQINYAHAEYFEKYKNRIFDIYDACKDEEYISKINYRFLTELCDILGINTHITWSSDYDLAEGKTERLVKLVQDVGGNYYLSGPAAKDYIIPELFEEAGIELDWMKYEGYSEYHQLGNRFEHAVSIIDLIFCEGDNAPRFIWGR